MNPGQIAAQRTMPAGQAKGAFTNKAAWSTPENLATPLPTKGQHYILGTVEPPPPRFSLGRATPVASPRYGRAWYIRLCQADQGNRRDMLRQRYPSFSGNELDTVARWANDLCATDEHIGAADFSDDDAAFLDSAMAAHTHLGSLPARTVVTSSHWATPAGAAFIEFQDPSWEDPWQPKSDWPPPWEGYVKQAGQADVPASDTDKKPFEFSDSAANYIAVGVVSFAAGIVAARMIK